MSRFWWIIVVFVVFSGCTEIKRPVPLIDGNKICTIITDFGQFETVEDAANSLYGVNWFDGQNKDDAICINTFSALELRHYLAQLTNRNEKEIQILDDSQAVEGTVLFVGPAEENPRYQLFAKQMKKRWKQVKSNNPEGARIDTYSDETQDIIVLSGRSPVGVLYAVYELLEQFGVRWMAPGGNGDVVPTLKRIILLPSARYVEADMHVRGLMVDSRISKRGQNVSDPDQSVEKRLEFYKWMGRNRMNFANCLENNFEELKRHGFQLYGSERGLYSSVLNPDNAYPYDFQNFDGDEEKPQDPYGPGGHFSGDKNKDGVLSYKEAHPEWFVHTTESDDENSSRDEYCFCSAQEDFIKEYSNVLISKLKNGGEWQHADIILFGPVEHNQWCHCTSCQAVGNSTDKLYHAIDYLKQAVSDAYKKEILDRPVRVWGQIYDTELQPGLNKVPKAINNSETSIIVLPVNRCFNHAMFNDACSEINAKMIPVWDAWFSSKNDYKGKSCIGESYNAEVYRDLPLVFTSIIQRDIPEYYLKGIRGIYYRFPRTENLGMQNFLDYHFARQSWRVTVQADSLKKGFFNFYYAGVADIMEEYYNLLEKGMANINAWRGELVNRINLLPVGLLQEPILPLRRFEKHFQIEAETSKENNGTDWVNTLQCLHEARYLLDKALESDVTDIVMKRLLEDEYQQRYAELTVRLYDNAIRYLTLGDDEPEMREESAIRLRQVAQKLNSFEVRSPALGITNGLQASGISDAVNYLLEKRRQKDVQLFKSTHQ